MKNILMATDLTAGCMHALERAVRIAGKLKCSLHILHVMPDYFVPQSWDRGFVDKAEAEELMRAHVNTCPETKALNIQITAVAGDPASEIMARSFGLRADLVIMGMHNKAAESFRDFFTGTTAERVIRNGPAPVLMVRDKPENGYARVLVPTDFSTAAQRAFELAVAVEPSASFEILHAYDVPFAGFITDRYAQAEILEEEKKALDSHMRKAVKDLEVRYKSLNVKKTLIQGSVYSGIMGAVKEKKPDLIAMGTHGRSGVAHAILGSIARDILIDPPCDMLVACC